MRVLGGTGWRPVEVDRTPSIGSAARLSDLMRHVRWRSQLRFCVSGRLRSFLSVPMPLTWCKLTKCKFLIDCSCTFERGLESIRSL